MSLQATDLVFNASASMPQDNVSTSGGAIDTTTLVVPASTTLFNALADKLKYVSSNAGDTMNVTVTGRKADGTITTETIALNGVTVVSGGVTFQSLLKIVIASAQAGTVTVTAFTAGTTIATLAPGVQTVRRMFYGAAANAAGGATATYYEKFFVKNTNATNAALSLSISETSDPSNVMDFGVAAAVNDSGSVANRTTAPGGIAFASTAVGIPGTDLASGSEIGVWARMTLPAGEAASEYAWGMQASAQTT